MKPQPCSEGSICAEQLTQENVDRITSLEASFHSERTFGARVADAIASNIGSWHFVLGQTAVLFIWVGLNTTLGKAGWDPYPFILLNLALSFQAAYTGPIIMMSQNRQNLLNDRRNQLDLQINLLGEREATEMIRLLRQLCEKQGIAVSENTVAFEEITQPEQLISQITKTAEINGKESKG